MKIMLITADYETFLADHHAARPGLVTASYEEQLQARYLSLFSGSDSLSRRFRAAGHDAYDVYANNPWMQSAWLRDVGQEDDRISDLTGQRFRARWRGRIPGPIKSLIARARLVPADDGQWMYRVLRKQIDYYRPDIVVNMAMDSLDHGFFQGLRGTVRALVGFHSAVELPSVELGDYDLAIASFPPTAKAFEAAGTKALFVRLAFEADVLKFVPPPAYHERDIAVSFVGAFGSIHSGRTRLLEDLCRAVPGLRVWAPDVSRLPRGACLGRRYQGRAWGRKTYEVMGRSRVVVNAHGDIPAYAANSRMYEATGCGALLVSDWKPDLQEIFEIGQEILAYSNQEECLRHISEALEDDAGSAQTAAAGQRRTLKDHTYESRVPVILDAFEALLS